MRLLVVEDETRLAGTLQRGLQAEGFAVDVAATTRFNAGWTQMNWPPQPLAMKVGRGAGPGTTHHKYPYDSPTGRPPAFCARVDAAT